MSWLLRTKELEEYGTPIYDDGDFFTIKLHHGGQLQSLPNSVMYVGNHVDANYFDFCEFDKFSMVELQSMAKELGYYGTLKFHVRSYEADSGFIHLETDRDVLILRKFRSDAGEVDIFIDCKTIFELFQSQVGSSSNVELNDVELNDDELDNSSDCESLYDSEYEDDKDDELFDAFIDKDAEFCGFDKKGKTIEPKNPDDEGMVEGESEDELEMKVCSDEDEDKPVFPNFNVKTDMSDPIFKLGMIFSDHKEFKAAVRSYAIKHGRQVKFTKNESRRVKAVCQDHCPWSIYASKMQDSSNLQIKSIMDDHTCNRQFKNMHANSKWLAQTYLDTFRSNPKMPMNCFREIVMKEHVVNVSRAQAYRTKKKVVDLIEGTYVEQYAKLWDYVEEIRRTNPGTSIIMKTVDGTLAEAKPRFERIYVCLEACKQGLKAGCRPVIGLDGCHLKGPYGGQLLSAVGVDPNNCMFPIAYAVVEGENKQSWTWFLECLQEDVGINQQYEWTFISDKQKGLLPAFETVIPSVHHRFCVMHLYNNFKNAGFKGKALKDIVWNAAQATNMFHFQAAMKQLDDTDEAAYNWFVDKPPIHWSRSHFSTFPKCDMLLNNICENFNKCILDAREKTILGLLERIRTYLMVRLQDNREKMKKWHGTVCPKIQSRIEKYKCEAAKCIPTWAGGTKFQISCMYGDQYTVELEKHTCSCGKWDLTGVPCPHGISAMFYRGEVPETYVHQYYFIDTYRKVYEPIINPINGPNMWPHSPLPLVLPPIYSRLPGRPKMRRKRQADEVENKNKLSKKHQNSLKCSFCGILGHNKRSCKKLKGNQGEKSSQEPSAGRQGSQGEQSIQGPSAGRLSAGRQGSQGEQGSQGPSAGRLSAGRQGSQGEQGNQGPSAGRLSAGRQGSQGEQGSQGPSAGRLSAGRQGSQGEQGSQGPSAGRLSAGRQGNQGEQSSQGPSAGRLSAGRQGSQEPSAGRQGSQGEQSNPRTSAGRQGNQGNMRSKLPVQRRSTAITAINIRGPPKLMPTYSVHVRGPPNLMPTSGVNVGSGANIRAPPQFLSQSLGNGANIRSPPQFLSQTPQFRSSSMTTPSIIKGGKKFITLSSLQAASNKNKKDMKEQ